MARDHTQVTAAGIDKLSSAFADIMGDTGDPCCCSGGGGGTIPCSTVGTTATFVGTLSSSPTHACCGPTAASTYLQRIYNFDGTYSGLCNAGSPTGLNFSSNVGSAATSGANSLCQFPFFTNYPWADVFFIFGCNDTPPTWSLRVIARSASASGAAGGVTFFDGTTSASGAMPSTITVTNTWNRECPPFDTLPGIAVVTITP